MLLLANGCSHTAGAEIEYPMQGECYKKAWPYHLANTLNYKHINLAVSGASNHRVLRTTIDFIGKRILNKQSIDNIFAVIMWPGAWRSEVFIEQRSNTVDVYKGWQPLVVGNGKLYKDTLSKDHYNYYKYWVSTNTYYQAMTQYYMDVIILQNYFITYKIPYLFWRAANTVLDKNLKFNSYQIQINKKRFPHPTQAKFDFCSLLTHFGHEPSIYTQWNHFGEDGHIKFSEILFKYIQDNQIVSC